MELHPFGIVFFLRKTSSMGRHTAEFHASRRRSFGSELSLRRRNLISIRCTHIHIFCTIKGKYRHQLANDRGS